MPSRTFSTLTGEVDAQALMSPTINKLHRRIAQNCAIRMSVTPVYILLNLELGPAVERASQNEMNAKRQEPTWERSTPENQVNLDT